MQAALLPRTGRVVTTPLIHPGILKAFMSQMLFLERCFLKCNGYSSKNSKSAEMAVADFKVLSQHITERA